jgi:hypothetical protein
MMATASLANAYLYEDGVSVGRILSIANPSFTTIYTRPDSSTAGTSTRQTGAFIVLSAAAGAHTYKLTYGAQAGTATFQNRKLWVATHASA